jgi:hypothetical protein
MFGCSRHWAFTGSCPSAEDPKTVRLIIFRVADLHETRLEEGLLLFHLGHLLLQLLNATVQPLIFQPQHIKPVKKLLPLNLRPFKGAFESR